MTKRVLAAMDDPHLTILAHPTGRLLLTREPYAINIEAVLDMVYGPLFFRLLAGHLPLAPKFAAQIIDTLFDGIAKAA